MHILPKRFVKIRRYGIYNHTVRRNMALRFTSEKQSSKKPNEKSLLPETKQQRFERLTGVNLRLCQACKTGRMITVRELPRIRSPGCSFFSFHNTNSWSSVHFSLLRQAGKVCPVPDKIRLEVNVLTTFPYSSDVNKHIKPAKRQITLMKNILKS